MFDKIGRLDANLFDLRSFIILLLSFAAILRFNEVINLRKRDISVHDSHMTIFLGKSNTDVGKVTT